MSARFASVVLDVDSTVCGIEGIDWLAERRGPQVAAKIVQLTDDAMRGVIPLESVYGARLDTIRPTREDINELAAEYSRQKAVGADAAVERLQWAEVHVVLVSGGIYEAIYPMAARLGDLGGVNVKAVHLHFDNDGNYVTYDAASPLTTSAGKAAVLEQLQLRRPILAVGDGSTDVAMKGVADIFGAYVGFARRENVVAKADVVIESFADLTHLVLGS